MRTNLPITNREHEYPGEQTLMSATDIKGRIVYANDAFVAISGFEREELVRKAHNVVRHPDIPPPVFEDLWKTLQAGLTWSAIVKNRRKNGDHYWVRANATPVRRNGELVGYLSVRNRPTREEVDASEALFKAMREGRAKGLRVYRGIVVRSGLPGLWSRTQQTLPARWRIRLGVWPLAPLAAAGAFAAGLGGGALAAFDAGALMLAAAAAFWLERQLARPLELIQAQSLAVAAGSPGAQARMNRVDEIGMIQRSVEQAGLNLRSLLDDVSAQIGGVRTASSEIAQGSLDLSARTEQTAASLEQTAASMEELTSTVSNNADGAQQAARLADVASQAAARGGDVVGAVVTTMDGIAQSSRRIGDIIGVIDSIAFQTNILALNAAVEAARAGEQGRGFAVVASEVRSLAHRSAEAAKEIKALVGGSIDKVDVGAQQVNGAGTAMVDIVEQVRRVGELIEAIHRATREQAAGIGQVNQAVAHLDQMTQQNAALVEQEAAAAGSLAAQAERLLEAVDIYRHGPR